MTVKFTACGKRHLVQRHKRSGEHVFWQLLSQRFAQCLDFCFTSDVGDEPLALPFFPCDDNGLTHPRLRQQRVLYLAQFDAETAYLYLEISSAEILNDGRARPIWNPAAQVTCFVKSAELRMFNKFLGG